MAEVRSREVVPGEAPAPAGVAAAPRALFRLMRPRQWTKNLLVFAALVFAKKLFDADALWLAALAFAAFCLGSSSVYIVNDVLDAERDRRHPVKRLRPIAAGLVSPGAAGLLAVLLTASALSLSFWVRPAFGVAIAVYIVMTHLYSLGAKHVVILDTMIIATGFVLRAVGGALAIDVPFTDWFVLCTFFGALFLALSKRRAELINLEAGAARHRRVLEHYTAATLQTFTAATMASVVITYAFYVIEELKLQASGPLLAFTVPFVLFAIFRYHHLVETTSLGDRPEEVLLQDRPTQLCVLGFTLVAVAALYLGS